MPTHPCIECGAPVSPTAKACPACGATVMSEADAVLSIMNNAVRLFAFGVGVFFLWKIVG